VYVSLYQAHLPKLDEFGAVDFDRDRGTVDRTPQTDDLLRYLDRFDPDSSSASVSLESSGPSAVVLLGAALLVVFAGELGALPTDLSLGAAVFLSLIGMVAVVRDVRG
jgi:hypothetical protein